MALSEAEIQGAKAKYAAERQAWWAYCYRRALARGTPEEQARRDATLLTEWPDGSDYQASYAAECAARRLGLSERSYRADGIVHLSVYSEEGEKLYACTMYPGLGPYDHFRALIAGLETQYRRERAVTP